ncbi:UNVERIFIED_CONTAM: hypothetical protein Slati_1691500 [Sesamum latifolium]|uniref:Uncharacterized protein n=1 Tax=Sesamum latifolium TaxID=2727402 RepID=A0AAW2WXY2_9LAMI
MGGHLPTVHGTKRLGELPCELLGFDSIQVQSFRLPSPDLGLGHEIECRFPSWTRRLCLLLEIVLRQIIRHRKLLSYSTKDCGHSFSERKHISMCIGDTSVM